MSICIRQRDDDAIACTKEKYGSRLRYMAYEITEDAQEAEVCETGIYTHADKEDAYHISYEAEFLCNEKFNGDQRHYDGAQLVEEYTTANGLKATIFMFGQRYNAVIYHSHIRYEFGMSAFQGAGDINEFKAFLDSLSD